tara:strand:+ start:119 stop:613 length:495 start_codon:yes stop_codon:yes gene_type:complete
MRIPYANFKTLLNDTWTEVDTVSIFTDKKVVVFSVPGAYLPNTIEQVMDYDQSYSKIIDAGIAEVYCVSVNDSAVMNSWFKSIGVENIKAIGDGEGVLTQGLGFLVSKPKQGLGLRSWRYSMLVENGEIIKQFIEKGQNDASDDDDPFKISDAKTMLNFLKNNG